MSVHVGGRGPGHLARVSSFSPSTLGSLLLAWWDAERTELITQSGNLVTSWKDGVAAYNLTGSTTARPTYGAASFNNRPGLTFDGVANMLNMASAPFPSGASPCEIWVLLDQTALPADTTSRCVTAYGSGSGATARRVVRAVVTGVNRMTAEIGNGASTTTATNSTVDCSGRNVLRVQIAAGATEVDVNGTAGASASVTPGTTAPTKTVIGATDNNGAFFQGVISAVLYTSPLNATQAAQLLAYLKARGGVP